MGTKTATKAEVQPMDLSKATSVFETHDANNQVSDEYIDAIRASILVGANGESAADMAFTRLISVAAVITEPQKARLLTGLAKSSETTARYGVIAEIITCGKVKPRATGTETWKLLRTAVNTVPTERLSDVVPTILEKAGDKVIGFGQVKNIISEMVKAGTVAKVIAPSTALGGYIKSSESSIVKAYTLHQDGVALTADQRVIAERQYALLGVILGK